MLRSKFIKTVSAVLAGIVVFTALSVSGTAVKADYTIDSAAIINDALNSGAHRCNVNAPRSGNVFVQLYGTFDAYSKDALIDQINSYRLEACQSGVRDPRNPGRGLTMADYVPLRWSRSMEEMAMLRAAESSYTLVKLKMTGENYTNSSYDVACFGESLAFSEGLSQGLAQCYAEKQAWNTNTGIASSNYAELINPSYQYFGAAGFNRAQAFEFTTQGGLDEGRIDVSSYNSQLAEVPAAHISAVTVTNNCLLNTTARLSLTCMIKVQSYNKWLNYSGIKLLATTWWSADPNMITVDPLGNATGKVSGMYGVWYRLNGVNYTSAVRVTDGSLIRDFASRLYSVALTRTPDQAGLDYWTNRLASHEVTGTQAAYGFFFSDEFTGLNLSNEQYVQRLYQTFLGRDPEPAGYAYWLTLMADGASRLEVFNGFSGSSEFTRICAYAGITP